MAITDESLRQFLADERENHIRTMRKWYRLDAATAEEIYHEAVLALLEIGAASIRNVPGYLTTTIKNKCGDWSADRKRMRPCGHGDELELLGKVRLPERAYHALEDLIEKLPEEADRSILRMKAKGLPFRLIASELHMNQGTVRRRHSEAVAHLRKFRVPA